jgi:predicted dehydrogenase
MRIGMLGCGYVANMYRLTMPLHPDLQLLGVTDLDQSRARNMATLTSSRAYANLDEMLADTRIELVLNLTNPRNHFVTTRKCLEAGKHVFSEKPLAMDFAEARHLVDLAEQRGLTLCAAPCTLLNEAAQTLWKAIREEPVGTIRLVYAEMDDGMVHKMPVKKWINEAGIPWPYADEFETGCTVEHAGYVLSWLAAFFGPAKTVFAYSTTLVQDRMPGEVVTSAPDFSVACIKFTSGVVARLTCGIYAPVDHSMRLFGDDGLLLLKDPRQDCSPLVIRRYMKVFRSLRLTPWRKRCPLLRSGRRHIRYRGSQERDFCSGIAEVAEAIEQRRACRLSARFCLHINELTLAIHNARKSGAPYLMTTTFDPIDPMPWAR